MTDAQCQYEFSWTDDKERDFSRYGKIERENGTGNSTQIVGVIDDERVLEHSCSLEAEPDKDYCIWHSERDDKTTDEIKQVLSDENRTICEPNLKDSTLENLDLSNYTFLWGDFDNSNIIRVDVSYTTICLCSFADATIKQADFTEANLSGTRFVDATFQKPNSSHQRTTFSEATCVGTNFIDADFRSPAIFDGVEFDRSTELCRNLIDANLTNADLSETVFTNLTLTGANLRGANLSSAEIDADFTNADLTNIYAFDADLSDSELERAVLDGANLQSADLRGAKIHSAVISDAVIDHDTKLDKISPYETTAQNEQNQDSKIEHINRAIWSYNSLSKLSKENALSKQAQQYYIKEKELKRRLNWLELCGTIPTRFDGIIGSMETKVKIIHQIFTGSDESNASGDSEDEFKRRQLSQGKLLLKSVKMEVSRLTIKYGEGHWNVLFSLGIVALLYSFVYPIWGLKQGGNILKHTVSLEDILFGSVYVDWDLWFSSIYFSIVTFTTLGYGDIQPIGFARYIAASEAVIGASLMALLVFVLGRRATW